MTDNPTAIRSHSWRPLCNLLRWHKEILKQGYVAPVLKSSLHKLYGRHHNLVDHYEISISQITFYVDVYFLYHCQYFYQTVYMSNTSGVLWETRTAYPSRAPELTPGFFVGFVLPIILVLCVVFLFCLPLFCVQCCVCLVSNVVCVLCPMLYVSCVQCCLCLFSSPLVFICDVRIVHFSQ